MDLAHAYRIMALRAGSPRQLVVATYRRLARERHPDHAVARGMSAAAATKAFIELRRAFEIIAAAGFPAVKAPPKAPPKAPAVAGAPPALHPTMPNVSAWNEANERLRRQDALERAAWQAQAQAAVANANATTAANDDSERCGYYRLEASTTR